MSKKNKMNNKIFIILIISIFITSVSTAQKVKVIDRSTYAALNNVYIFCGDKYTVTDENGIADISSFNPQDSIIIQFQKYRSFKCSYKNVEKGSFFIQLSPSMIEIEEVVVSANRWEQNKRTVPNKITSINKREIEFYNPQTAADLLKSSEEVFVQKSQLGGGSPMIRGFAANRVLLTVDGVRMNNAIFRSGNLQNVISLDANTIQSTEVIFGPGSVIYGSDALGGVMNFSTIKPNISGSRNENNSFNMLTRYSSANFEKTIHIDFNLGRQKWAFLSSYSFSDFDNLKMGTRMHKEYQRLQYVDNNEIVNNENPDVQKFSGFSQINTMQKLRFKPTNKLDINYAFHYSRTSDIPRYDRLIQYSDDTLKYAEWYYGPQEWIMNNLNIKYTEANTVFDKMMIIIAHQNYKESRHDRKLEQTDIRERFENVKATSANFDFEKTIFNDLEIFYGFELIHNVVFSDGQKRNVFSNKITDYASRYPDNSDYDSAASYMSFSITVNEKISFSGGVRYNQILLNARFDDEFYDFPFEEINLNTGALTGSIGSVYQPNDETKFSLNISSGFRAPNIDDAAKIFDSEPGNVVVPNQNLNPEYAYNADFGVTRLFSENIELNFTAFYSMLQNVMVRRDYSFNGSDSIMYDEELSRVQALVNADNAIVFGGHLGAKANFTNYLAMKANINYTKGEDSEGKPIRHVAPMFASSHILYTAKGFKADLYFVYNHSISYENLAETERSKPYLYASDNDGNSYSPSWYTLNFMAAWQINTVLKINFGVENILDHRYRGYSSGIVAPGRNFIVSLRLGL